MSARGYAAKHERAAAMFVQADQLAERGRQLRAEGDALIRAADRMQAFAAAVADGRDEDIREIAVEMAGAA